MRISDWSSDVCSSDLFDRVVLQPAAGRGQVLHGRERRRPLGLTGEKLCPAFAPRLEPVGILGRSEARRVGKECVSKCRSRWSPYHLKKKTTTHSTDSRHSLMSSDYYAIPPLYS